jgi:Zn-dependent protease with chaperone function
MAKYYVHPRERVYFTLELLFTLLFLTVLLYLPSLRSKAAFGGMRTIAAYILVFILVALFRNGLFVGLVRGSCVRVGPEQFPEVHDILRSHSERLGLKRVPALYIMQSGGILNALALRCVGKNYVVIYSSVLEAAYKQGLDAVSFIIGHELGHIARMHMSKKIMLFPSALLPPLAFAYSRACEYTCDGIAFQLCPEGAVKGLCILGVGPELHERVNVMRFIEDCGRQKGGWGRLAEMMSSHPFLPNRIMNIAAIHQNGR